MRVATIISHIVVHRLPEATKFLCEEEAPREARIWAQRYLEDVLHLREALNERER
ncbi:MAG TPA: hypothetical protein VNJ09_03410 [Chthonomonadales bacterium]|nr:hypothetical protein [Chthonomonadales bacterium]